MKFRRGWKEKTIALPRHIGASENAAYLNALLGLGNGLLSAGGPRPQLRDAYMNQLLGQQGQQPPPPAWPSIDHPELDL